MQSIIQNADSIIEQHGSSFLADCWLIKKELRCLSNIKKEVNFAEFSNLFL